MIRMIEVARVSRLAIITASAGLSVQLLPTPIAQAPSVRLIAPAIIASNPDVPAPAVQGAPAAAIMASTISATSSVASPDVRAGEVTAKPVHIAAMASVAVPSLVVGEASVKPALIGITSGTGAPSVTPGAALVGAAGIASGSALPSPVVIPGAASVKPTTIVTASIVASPLMMVGSVAIVPSIMTRTSSVVSPAVVVASSYDSDALTAFNAMTVQPDATRKRLYNDMIVGLKADGVWTSLDWLVLLAAHDEQSARLNIAIPSKALAAVNSPAFTPDLGYSGDVSGSFLLFGESLGAAGKATANSTTIGVWCNQTGGTLTGLSSHFGRAGNQTPQATIRPQGNAGNSDQIALNDNNAGNFRQSTGTRNGNRTAVRLDGNLKQGFFNGARVFSSTAVAVVGIANGNMSLLRNDNAYSADRLAAAYTGAGLTDALVAALHDRLSTYLTAIGAA